MKNVGHMRGKMEPLWICPYRTENDSHQCVALQSCKTVSSLKIRVPYGQLRPHKVNDWFDMPTSPFLMPSSSPATTLTTMPPIMPASMPPTTSTAILATTPPTSPTTVPATSTPTMPPNMPPTTPASMPPTTPASIPPTTSTAMPATTTHTSPTTVPATKPLTTPTPTWQNICTNQRNRRVVIFVSETSPKS